MIETKTKERNDGHAVLKASPTIVYVSQEMYIPRFMSCDGIQFAFPLIQGIILHKRSKFSIDPSKTVKIPQNA
jgi:hypothetical protein